MDSNAAALYQSFWRELLRLTFHDDLPEDFWPSGGSRWWAVMEAIIAQPQSKWWDNRATPAVEGRDEILRQAFVAGLAELEKLQGKDPAKWSWGDLHTITFRNQSLGESGVAPLEALLNRGPFPTAGGEAIVNATGWDAVDGFQVDWLPSMRMIVDLGDFERSLSVHTTGQSGHAFHPHYADMVDLWRTIQYHPMRYAADGIQSSAEAHLHLIP
jgi:penicillin amidase